MRQILINNNGAIVARMPRPPIERGCVLVRVRFSLISVGTELAPLRAAGAKEETTPSERAKQYSQLAYTYLGKAVRNPRLAARRVAGIAQNKLSGWIRRDPAMVPALETEGISWTRCGAKRFEKNGDLLELVTDTSQFGYQVITQAIPISPGKSPVVEVRGRVQAGSICIGLLNEDQSGWLGSRNYDAGPFEDQLIFNQGSSSQCTLVIANAGTSEEARASISSVRVLMASGEPGGLPLTELDDQGWGVGYSAAGEVVGIGEGITDLTVGDRVACAGAGKANHADFISVPRNLVCRVPDHCDLKTAATTTVGTIALQGVRRTLPQLGDNICVLGLGLIGQLTVQMLRANGCKVIGFDMDAARVKRALDQGMDYGASEEAILKQLVRDATGGYGADRTIITAATKSDAVVNLAMETTRAKGAVVIVGDIGLNVRREVFYRKEIDLLMSTSYGPGRYDRSYEEGGHDYPVGYVRWTLNRNMQAYLDLASAGRINPGVLIDRIASVDNAPELYRSLAESRAEMPLGVLICYPDDTRSLEEPSNATRITIRGHKKPAGEPIHYALVGAGAFGTSMLVPALQKVQGKFFLRGLVSRNSTAAGNFVRANRVEVLASDLDDILKDPNFDLIVIATRHHEHASQTIRSLKAGKHVFVEKPLAVDWEELGEIVSTYQGLSEKPILMVGFNRRFSPALQMLKEVTAKRQSPCIINYRLNGGYIPPDHWIQNEQGKGRNIGEACHMYDAFRFLAGSAVVSIAATAINPKATPYLRNDNFAATVGYADGSVGNLIYTSLGPKQGLPKERVELFCDGDAYILDDFKSLTRASDGNILWQSPTVDKGHQEEMNRFGAAIEGESAPIPFDELIESTAVALHIEDLLHGRSGVSDDES